MLVACWMISQTSCILSLRHSAISCWSDSAGEAPEKWKAERQKGDQACWGAHSTPVGASGRWASTVGWIWSEHSGIGAGDFVWLLSGSREVGLECYIFYVNAGI